MTDTTRSISLSLANDRHGGTVPQIPTDGEGMVCTATMGNDGRLTPGWAAGGGMVAAATGRETDTSEPTATLYTVPADKGGLYRLHAFVGPASENGSGDVSLLLTSTALGAGNLDFLEMTDLQIAHMSVGESSTAPAESTMLRWFNEGDVITYALDSTFSGGDWVWGVALELIATGPAVG